MTRPKVPPNWAFRAFYTKGLPPKDPVGQHFLSYFSHQWDFLEATLSETGQTVDWCSESRYPLQPRNLWEKYLEKNLILGLRFGSFTKYLLLDIDRYGCYHPAHNRKRFRELLQAMENIGLCRPLIVQSSDSGGLHVYYFLPEAVHTFTLALTIKKALVSSGFRQMGGRLEILPNVKHWKPDTPSNYQGHRLPLQVGSFLLNSDLEQVTNDTGEFLKQADLCALNQDIEALKACMEQAKKKSRYFRRGVAIEDWYLDLQHRIAIGWTGYHQTNDLLRDFAINGIVFAGLGGQELVDYIVQTAKSTQGYTKYCRHQHEIKKRAKEWARYGEANYYPYNGKRGGFAVREASADNDNVFESVTVRDPSQARHIDTIERVKAIVAMLKGEEIFPTRICKRLEAIVAKSKEAFGIEVSPTTLYRPKYKPLWHPEFDQSEREELEPENQAPVKADSSVEENAILGNPWDEEELEEKTKPKPEASLQVMPLTECLYLPAAWEESVVEAQPEPQAIGEREGLTSAVESNLQNQSQAQDTVSSVLLCSLVLQNLSTLLSTATTINPASNSNGCADSTSLVSLANSAPSSAVNPVINFNQSNFNQSDFLIQALNFNSLDILISEIEPQTCTQELVNCLQELIDQCCLCSNKAGATCQKPLIVDNQNLLLFKIILGGKFSSEFALSEVTEAIGLIETGISWKPGDEDEGVEEEEIIIAITNPQAPPIPLEDTNANTPNEQILPSQWEEARFRLHLPAQVKQKLQEFCSSLGTSLVPRERVALEQFLKYCLMQCSPYPVLRLEARDWFALKGKEIVAQIEGFTAFWDYFGDLLF